MSEKTMKFPLWLVGDPHSESEAGDLLHPMRNVEDLVEELRLWSPSEIEAIYTDEAEALAEARRRIQLRDAGLRSRLDAALAETIVSLQRLANLATDAGEKAAAEVVLAAGKPLVALMLERERARKIAGETT